MLVQILCSKYQKEKITFKAYVSVVSIKSFFISPVLEYDTGKLINNFNQS